MLARTVKKVKKVKSFSVTKFNLEPKTLEQVAWLAQAIPDLRGSASEALPSDAGIAALLAAPLDTQGFIQRAAVLRAALSLGLHHLQQEVIQAGQELPVFNNKIPRGIPKLLKRAISRETETSEQDRAPFEAEVPHDSERAEWRLLMGLAQKQIYGEPVYPRDDSLARLRMVEREYLAHLYQHKVYTAESLDLIAGVGTPAEYGIHRDVGNLAKRASGGLELLGIEDEQDEQKDPDIRRLAQMDLDACRIQGKAPRGREPMGMAEELEAWQNYYGFWEKAYQEDCFSAFRAK